MTFSPKPNTWKRWLAWSAIPLLAFLTLYLVSGTVGLSDDESYYWVLAQKPALGYAYHPPMIAWMIFLAQKILGPIAGSSSALVVRFFSCACMGVLLALSMDWMQRAGGATERRGWFLASLISFAGVFGLGWMMVPDVPLYLGWILAFHSSWRIGHEDSDRVTTYFVLAVGVCLAMLGKYSGILIPFSAMVALWFMPHGKSRLLKAFSVAMLGAIVALVPILIWNSQHEWQSILYQIHDRHEDAELSWKRYARFWLIELVAAGPVLLFYSFSLIKRAIAPSAREKQDPRTLSLIRVIACWMLPPALIYGIQPLWSDFKPHWAFIAWLPAAMALAYEATRRKVRLLPLQIGFGWFLIIAVLVSLHTPLIGRAIRHFKGDDLDPDLVAKMDVTNDLYGWNRLPEYLSSLRMASAPYVIASRYQTASQAAAALGSVERVSLLPRDLKARDEWPTLPVSSDIGPEWPALTQPVIYVGDNRYDAPPEFKSSRCEPMTTLETRRSGLLAKKILVWECEPINWPAQ